MRKQVKTKHVLWAMIAVFFGILLSAIATNSIGYEKIPTEVVAPPSNTTTEISNTNNNTPESFYFIKDVNKKPIIKAESYFVGDLDTGEVILEKNKDNIFPIASVSKLMTATISKEIQNQTETTKVSKKALATYGENGGFRLNENIKVSDLVYPLLLESSNDAAEIIAEDSGRDLFIKKMNEKAKSLNLLNTSFLDPVSYTHLTLPTTERV